jgi:hypoxanthine phosphoribosyltransferase
MNYRSVEELNRSIVSNMGKVPPGTDLVVGVPRSGLLAANLLALHLNVPLTDVEGFVNGRILQSGNRLKQHVKSFDAYKRVVFLDDSLYSGSALRAVKEQVKGLYPDKEIYYGAVFVVPDGWHARLSLRHLQVAAPLRVEHDAPLVAGKLLRGH